MLRKAFDRGKICQLNSGWRLPIYFPKSLGRAPGPNQIVRKKLPRDEGPLRARYTAGCGNYQHARAFDQREFELSLHAVKAAIADAIKECQTAQSAEGKRLQKDFRARLAELARLHSSAANLAETSLPQRRQRLLKNLTEAGLEIEENDEKLLKELALYADRVDIAEELTRIQSHLHSAQELIQKEGTGRELDLLQELLREWNTLGNKSRLSSSFKPHLRPKRGGTAARTAATIA
jgi:hypothetical protein